MRFLLGNTSFIISVCLLVLLIGLMEHIYPWQIYHKKTKRKISIVGLTSFASVLIIFLIMLMYCFMLLKHPFIVEPVVRRSYYLFPATSFILMISAVLLKGIYSKYAIPKFYVRALLICLILGNFIFLNIHTSIMHSHESVARQIIQSTKVIRALKNLNDPKYIVPEEVSNDALYKIFRERHLK